MGRAGKNLRTPVELEGVGPISVGCAALQVLGQVDDHDGIERAFLHATEHACSKHINFNCVCMTACVRVCSVYLAVENVHD